MNSDALKLAAAAFKTSLQQDDRQGLIAAARRLVELKAPLGGQWQGLSQAVFRWGELDLALAALNEWHRQGTPAKTVNYEKAMLLSRAGLVERGLQVAEALPEDFPNPVANAYLRGALAVNLARPAEADRQFRRAIAAVPESGRSWQGLAQLKRLNDNDVAAMERIAATARFEDDEDQAALENALGLTAHHRGRYAEAFARFDRATGIARRARPHDRRDNEQSAAIAGSWTAAVLTEFAERPAASTRRPIFVTGLPRSGTTLVEQILAAHSSVTSGGELGLALQVEATADGFAPDDFRRYLALGGTMEALRDLYLRLVAERVPGDDAFVDKSLNQSRGLGPFSALFPDAPIVWLRRDPLDNAWSMFRTWLSRSATAGWSLEDIAHHMQLEDRLFEHWTHTLGERILVVPYEDLVEDPIGWTGRITRHCGFEPEPGQRDFHASERRVTTASSLQVREPVNREGVGSAEPYRAFLQPFADAYEAVA